MVNIPVAPAQPEQVRDFEETDGTVAYDRLAQRPPEQNGAEDHVLNEEDRSAHLLMTL